MFCYSFFNEEPPCNEALLSTIRETTGYFPNVYDIYKTTIIREIITVNEVLVSLVSCSFACPGQQMQLLVGVS